MKLQSSGNEYHLVVPKEIREAYNWQKGDVFIPSPLENGKGITFLRVEKDE